MHCTISNDIEALKLRNRFPQDPGSLPHSNGLRADHQKVEASKQFAIRPMLIRGLRRGGRPTLDITGPRASNLTRVTIDFYLDFAFSGRRLPPICRHRRSDI